MSHPANHNSELAMPASPSALDTARQIDGFLAPYDPAIRSLAQDARAQMRRRLPTATELVYDNYNALVFGYSPTDRTPHAFVSLALYPRWVTLFFLHGATLPDPMKLLSGTGKQVRGIRLGRAADLERPEIEALLAQAVQRCAPPLPASAGGSTIIKSVSAKQRPRR